MKSERRHELQHNVLADWLATSVESLKPYQNMIFAAATLLLLLVAAYIWWSRDAVERTTTAWDELNVAVENGNPGDHGKSDGRSSRHDRRRYGCRRCGRRALDGRLRTNVRQQSLGRTTACQGDRIVRVGARALPVALAAGKGHFRPGTAEETKGDADSLEKALGLYEEVAKLPSGAYVAAARHRADDLKRPATRQLYERFAQFDPKPVYSPSQGERPPMDMKSLPNEGPIIVPGGTSMDRKPNEKPTDQTTPAETKPAEETKPSAETMPAAESKPSDEKKPAEEKMPSEEPAK